MGLWMCKCGRKNEGKFCVKCGSPKPEQWICVCGKTNTSKFCVACGRKKSDDVASSPDKSNDSSDIAVAISQPKVVTHTTDNESKTGTFPSKAEKENGSPMSVGTVIANSSPITAKPATSSKSKGKIVIGVCGAALILTLSVMAYFMVNKTMSENSSNLVTTNSIDKDAEILKENTMVTATYYVVNCDVSITLRDAPFTTGKELAQVPLGKPVGFIERADNGFYKINYDGLTGYALAQYLSQEKPSLPPTTSSSADKNYALGKVVLNDEEKDVIAKMGQPTNRQVRDSGKVKATYDNMIEVIYANGRVIGLVSLSSTIKTSKGVHEGSDLSDVIAAYGSGYTKSSYDKNDLYEYIEKDDHGQKYILRFAVRQSDGHVDYISIRYAD